MLNACAGVLYIQKLSEMRKKKADIHPHNQRIINLIDLVNVKLNIPRCVLCYRRRLSLHKLPRPATAHAYQYKNNKAIHVQHAVGSQGFDCSKVLLNSRINSVERVNIYKNMYRYIVLTCI